MMDSDDIRNELKQLRTMLTGNGTPRRGLLFRVDVLMVLTIVNLAINAPGALITLANLVSR